MNVNERRWQIIDRLNHRREDTIQNLAEEFSVSYDSIQRDIRFLEGYFPITTARGNNGAVRLMDGFYLSRKYLTYVQYTELERLLPLVSEESAAVIRSILHDFALPGSPEGY